MSTSDIKLGMWINFELDFTTILSLKRERVNEELCRKRKKPKERNSNLNFYLFFRIKIRSTIDPILVLGISLFLLFF